VSILDMVRPGVRAMKGYVPGEQPRGLDRLIKLNTNENPYPPPRVVLDAIREAVTEGLRRYPEPSARPVREAAARAYGLEPDQIIVGNGSDDILTILLRTFVDGGEMVAAPDPTYSLYPTLTEIQGGRFARVPWSPGGILPIDALIATGAKLIFVVRPNAPTGHAVHLSAVAELCERAPGAVVLDEAYADFAADNGLGLLSDHANLIVTRSFSKTFSMAGMRIGLGFGDPDVIAEMHKIRDSYNVGALAQAAAVAALDNLAAYRPSIEAIRDQRDRLSKALEARGFTVPPSEANFVLATVPDGGRDGRTWFTDLRARGMIVRYFDKPGLEDKLRISVGTTEEMDALLADVDALLR